MTRTRLDGWLAMGMAIAGAGAMVGADALDSGPTACGGIDACGVGVSSALVPTSGAPRIAGGPRLVAFSSAVCPACERMKPVLASVERTCGAVGEIARIDVDAPGGASLGAAYRVTALPTFLAVDGEGREVSRLVGVQSKVALERAVEDVRGTRCAPKGNVEPPPPL